MNTPDKQELDQRVAEALGFTLIEVDYIGSDEETEWQKANNNWLDKMEIQSIGSYWVNVKADKFYAAERDSDGNLFHPSTNWEQCGKLIEEYKMNLWPFYKDNREFSHWVAIAGDGVSRGATPQEAACRALIASMENGDE